jgi:hypothetical protein
MPRPVSRSRYFLPEFLCALILYGFKESNRFLRLAGVGDPEFFAALLVVGDEKFPTSDTSVLLTWEMLSRFSYL